MNDKEKAKKWDDLVAKSGNAGSVIDIEGQKWLLVHPEMQRWVEINSDIVEWMTEGVKFAPRSDCG